MSNALRKLNRVGVENVPKCPKCNIKMKKNRYGYFECPKCGYDSNKNTMKGGHNNG